MTLLVDCPQINEGILYFKEKYPQLKTLCDDPLISIKRSKYDDPFQGMVRTVIGQQVSTKAAASVWNKMVDLLGEKFDADDVMQQKDSALRDCGLSGRKVEYIQGLCKAVLSGDIDFDKIENMSDEDVVTTITNLRGFGQWSADVFLLFGLGRGNVWAKGDLGVKLGLKDFLALEARPTDQDMLHYGEEFAPYGSAASLIMWHIKAAS